MALTYDYVLQMFRDGELVEESVHDALLTLGPEKKAWIEELEDEGYAIATDKLHGLDSYYRHPDPQSYPECRIVTSSRRKVAR